MRRPFFVLAVAVVSVLVVAQVLVPLYLSRRVEAALEKSLGVAGLRVRVRIFPFFRLAGGGIDAILVEGENLAAGDLNLDRLEAAVTSLRVDVPELWKSGTLSFRDPGRARVRVEVSEDSLNRFLQARLGSGVRVVLTRGRAEVISALRVRGEETPLVISGVPVLAPGGELGFEVREVSLAGTVVPEAVREVALSMLGLPQARLDFGQLPWPVRPEQVEVEEGKVVLVAGGGRP